MKPASSTEPRTVEGDDAPARLSATTLARLVLSATSLISVALGAVALAAGIDVVRTVALMVFCALGIGSAPWQLNASLSLVTRLTLTGFTSVSVLTVVSTWMESVHAWHPALAFIVVAALCVALHGVGLRRALLEVRTVYVLSNRRGTPRQRFRGLIRSGDVPQGLAVETPRQPTATVIGRWAPLLLAVPGALLCIGAALAHRHIDPGFGGFPAQIGLLWYVGLAVLVTGILLSRAERDREIALAVLLLLVVLTLTPALVYDGPRSQSAAKHVDLVEQIRTLHSLKSSVAVYNAWGGFFAVTAWLCDIAGIRDPMGLATFWPAILGFFRITALRYMFGQVLRTPYQRWVAVALAILADPLGADYFSPQSVGFVLGLVVFGLALSRRRTVSRMALMLVAGCVLAITHQLSPYIVGGVLIVLVVFRQIRPWWSPALVLVPAIGWALLHRDSLRGFISLADIGQAQNFRPPKTVGSSMLERLPIVQDTVIALVIGVFVIGSLAAIALLRHPRVLRSWAFAACPAVGLVLIAANPYGQEGIFRAVLFGIPWLALLAAGCFPRPPVRVLDRWSLGAVYATLTVTFLIASFGLDATNVIRQSDLAAFHYFQQQGEGQPGSSYYLLTLGNGDLPSAVPMNGSTHQSIGRDVLNDPVRQEPGTLPARTVERLTAELLFYSGEQPASARLYALWSPISSKYDAAYGVQSPQEFAELRNAFAASPYWQIGFQKDGTAVFRFDGAGYGGGGR